MILKYTVYLVKCNASLQSNMVDYDNDLAGLSLVVK